MVKAQALPGRRFSKDAERKGWLYINTWYMIGPWESFGREDFSIVHPPEVSIDFDAVYTDGQIGTGIAETDSDPLKGYRTMRYSLTGRYVGSLCKVNRCTMSHL